MAGVDREQSIVRARTLVDGFNIIGCDALNVGTKDLAEGIEFLQEMRSRAQFPFISSNIVDAQSRKHLFEPYKIIEKSGFRFGVIGLTAKLPEHVVSLDLLDPISEGRKILDELARETDFQVVLFNGPHLQAWAVRDSLEEADFIFLSGDTRTPRWRTRRPESERKIYPLGKQGKSLGVVQLQIKDSHSDLVDITGVKSREDLISRQLERLGQKDPSMKLEEIYKDNPRVLDRIRQIREELESIKEDLAHAENTTEFNFVAMNKQVEDDLQLLAMVNETLAECKRIGESHTAKKSSGEAVSQPRVRSRSPQQKVVD